MQISSELKENSQRQWNEKKWLKKEILHFLAVYHHMQFFTLSNSVTDQLLESVGWHVFKPPTQASILVPVVVSGGSRTCRLVREVIQIFMNTLSLCLHTTLNDFSSFVISYAWANERKKDCIWNRDPQMCSVKPIIVTVSVRNERLEILNYLIVDSTLHCWLKMDILRF